MKIQHFMALLVLSLLTVLGARAAVLAGPITNAANGHVYYLLSANTWTASEAEAQGLGGHLVTISEADENEWVVNTFFPLTGVPYALLWIGLNDRTEFDYRWASGQNVIFTYWYPGEPDPVEAVVKDYVAIRHPSDGPPTGSWKSLTNNAGLNPNAPIFGVVELTTPPLPPPTVVTLPANQFMPGKAQLNALVNPNGSLTLVWFEWGYYEYTPQHSLSGSNVVGISNVIDGLDSRATYHFNVWAWNAFGLVKGPILTFTLSNQLPVVTTLAANNLSNTNTQLRGQVNPRGWPTTAWFEWGTNTTYGNLIGMQDVGQGSSISNLNVVLNGLTVGQNYYYRLVASNGFGLVQGQNQTFNLNPQLPAVTTLAADQLTTNSARLRGQVNPNNWPAAAWFEWGTDTNYGNLIGMQDVSSVTNLNVVLNGLMIGPTYHYRLVASNAFGAVFGADQTLGPTTRTWTGADPSGYWSAPANWSPAVPLANGADLVFPGGLPPGDMVSTNNLTNRFFRSISVAGGHTIRGNRITLTNGTSVIINSGTNEIACDWIFSATPSPSAPYYEWPRIGIYYPGELTLSGNIGGSSLNVSGGRLVMRGQFPGGRMYAYGGIQAFYGDFPHALSVMNVGGIILVQGSQPNLSLTTLWEMESAACASLSASGAVGEIAGCGHITVDSTLSVKNIGHYGGWGGLDIRLNGTNVGEYGKLVASGDVSLNYGSLLPSAGFHPQAGQVFTTVEKTSPGLVANEFLGPEGSVTTRNGIPLRISYVGGDGNDVTLTVEATNTVNVQPTVSIISPTNGAIVAAPFGGTIQANAVDSDGTVVRVDFFSDAMLVGSVSNAPFNLAVTNIAAGTHALFAMATDDRGATKRSATVTVTVVTPVPIVLSGIQRPSGTQSVFSYSANVGLSYAVERAATLSNWTSIRSNTANVNPMTVTDFATNQMNFYRVRRLPNP